MKNESVSISKALGIILMVLAHSGFSYIGDAAINMFHMPLFFFISGYCFNDRHLVSTKNFILGKIKKVYIPYVKYGLIFLLLHNVFYCLHIYESGEYSLSDIIWHASRIVVSMGTHDQLLGGYWFMGDLFWGLIIAYTLLKLCRNNTAIGIVISLVVSIIMNQFEIHVPVFQIRYSDFFSSAFILTGIWYKRKGLNYEQRPYYILPIAVFFVIPQIRN